MANAVPLAPTLVAPDNNGYEFFYEPIVFTWVFNDPGDVQASASLRYKVPAGAWVTLTDVVGMPTNYTLPGSTLTNGILYEWQVQTKDTAGQWSPWSASRFFTTVTVPPTHTITAPAVLASPGVVINTTPVLVSWDPPAGYTRDGYEVTLRRNEPPWDVYYGVQNLDPAAQFVMFDMPLASDTPGPLVLSVALIYYGNPLGEAIYVQNLVLPPEVPLIVLEQVPDLAHPPLLRPEVVVSVTNPLASDAGHLDTESWDLFRDGVRIAKDRAPNTTYTDRLPGAGGRDYVAVAKTTFGGTAESY